MKHSIKGIGLFKLMIVTCLSLSSLRTLSAVAPINPAPDHPARIDKQIRYPAESRCFQLGKGQALTSIKGDFDGDGKRDIAKIVASTRSNQQILKVWLSSREGKPAIQLEKFSGNLLNNMSIAKAKRGEQIQTACARGYTEVCSPGDPLKFKLKTDAIWLIECEAAASIFVWNSDKQRFQHYWYSD